MSIEITAAGFVAAVVAGADAVTARRSAAEF
jgi:hypothetical protein